MTRCSASVGWGFVRFAVFAVFATAGLSPASAQELSEGQIAAAFGQALTGDPDSDFRQDVDSGKVFTVYVLSGPLSQTVSAYGVTLAISEAATLGLVEVRAPGQVTAYQNSIGTLLSVRVSFPEACVTLSKPAVLAEIDIMRFGEANPVTMTLGNANYQPPQVPEYTTCDGVAQSFDDSPAGVLSVEWPDGPTAVDAQAWGYVKALFAHR